MVLKDFQDRRAKLTENYEAAMKKVELMKGSEAYTEEYKKVKQEYDSSLSGWREYCRKSAYDTLQYMMNVVESRPAKAPTEEQIRLIELLKMKTKVTEEDCSRVVESVKDCPMAVSIVSEIALNAGIMRNYNVLCKEMTKDNAVRGIWALRKGIDDFLSYESTRSSRIANRYAEDHYGTGTTLFKRPLFNDKEGCFGEIAHMSPETLELFCNAVDREREVHV